MQWPPDPASILMTIFTMLAGGIFTQLRSLVKSVEELNASMKVIVTRVDSHEKRLDSLEHKI